jgi:hypothetical protein
LYPRRVDLEKSHKTLDRIERLRLLNRNRDWVNHDLYRLMYKEDLYIVAYERIKSKPGNMTAGTDGRTMDGFSLEAIQGITHAMRTEQFHFQPVRTVYIPKPNGKKRKLGIPICASYCTSIQGTWGWPRGRERLVGCSIAHGGWQVARVTRTENSGRNS